MNLWAKEPAVTLGLLTTAVASVIALLVAFGVSFTPAQQVAILGVIAGVGPLLVTIVTRAHVTPAALVAAKLVPGVGLVAGPALRSVDDGAPVVVVAAPPDTATARA